VTSLGPISSAQNTAPGTGCRVILVGRTGVEGALRADPALELVRVRTPLDAIGELGDPIDHGSPPRAAVIVAPEAEPVGGRARSFVQALRLVDPDAVVLRVGRSGAQEGPGSFDGVVDATLTPGALRAWLDRGPRAPEPVHSVQTGAPDAMLENDTGAEPKPAAPGVGDEPIVAAMLRGEDLIPAALAQIRARTGAPDVIFTPGEVAPESGDVPVRWRERALGVLRSELAARRELERQAVWLAGWLTLGAQRRELESAAFTDPLTGAWNRRYFDRFLPGALERTRRNRGSLTLMVFDIDDFKQYNDRYGHGAGDEILVGVVDLLRSTIRPTDRVCRIGGDEFAVIFHEPTGPREPTSRHPESVFGIARRFQRQVCERRFPKLGDEAPGTLTISGGLATFPWDGTTAEALLERADELALRSKREGKNAITLGQGAVRACDGGHAEGQDPPTRREEG